MWPQFLRVSFGSVLVQLWCCYPVQFWFSFGSVSLVLFFTLCKSGSALVQFWFSFVWYDCLRFSFVSVRPHVFLWPELPWFSFVFIIHSFFFSGHINFTVCTETSLLHPVKPTRIQVLLSSGFFWV